MIMSSIARRTMGLVGTLLFVGSVLTAPTASAASTRAVAGAVPAVSACQANPNDANCDGVDPEASGCAADAYTVASATGQAGTVDLRYSPSCKTNWGRLLKPNMNISVFVIRQDGASAYSIWYSWPTAPIWSPMLYSPVQKAQAGYDRHCCDSGGEIRTGLF